MEKLKTTVISLLILGAILVTGCSRPVVREYVKPPREKDKFLKLKKVAVLPFDNFTDTKDAEKAIESLLIPAIFGEEVFEDVVDPRFVRDALKKLKITSTDILDREQVRKLGDELGVQAVILGKVVSFGKGKDKEAASEVSIDMSLVDVKTASILWTGNVTASGGLTVGKVFGVTPGQSDIEVARKAIRLLVEKMADSIKEAREKELKGMLTEIKQAELKEQKRLEALKKQTKALEEKIKKANEEALKIKQRAQKEAESMKAEIETEKAALEAEKAQIESEKEALEKEKLQVESERAKIEEEKRKLEQLKAEISALEEQKSALEEQILKLKEQIKEESVEGGERSEELKQLEEKKESLNKQIEQQQEQIQNLEEKIKEKEAGQ